MKLRGGQVWSNDRRQRSTNDLWSACASVFGISGFVLGDSDQHTTPITGLFG